ncbi:unnamed protein product [Pleuronectes platessa]|uniref:Uncharacterized protein n=1 Tax=Pleuronectes platessa TaxID=8262 RepID=A0A9N7UDZ4_PLEPL|nr:unnamed protein product [Pleuronectes platessa]
MALSFKPALSPSEGSAARRPAGIRSLCHESLSVTVRPPGRRQQAAQRGTPVSFQVNSSESVSPHKGKCSDQLLLAASDQNAKNHSRGRLDVFSERIRKWGPERVKLCQLIGRSPATEDVINHTSTVPRAACEQVGAPPGSELHPARSSTRLGAPPGSETERQGDLTDFFLGSVFMVSCPVFLMRVDDS